MPLLNVTNYDLEGGQLVSGQVCSAPRQRVLVSHGDKLEPGSAAVYLLFIRVSPQG